MNEIGVKSARRVFAVLELFKELQRDLRVADVVQRCGFPNSSASALMRQMAELGYLNYDRFRRSYQPAPRLALLTSWMGTSYFPEDAVLSLMNDLNRETKETIILGTENGDHVRYIHAVEARGVLRLHAMAGQVREYATSSIGLALMSTWGRRKTIGYLQRFNATRPPDKRVELEPFLERLSQVKAAGHAVSTGHRDYPVASLAMLLPSVEGKSALAVSIVGALDRIERDRAAWIALMRRKIDQYFEMNLAFSESSD